MFTVDYQSYNKRTILMKLVSKVTEIYCIADDFCKEYHSELNKTSLSLSNPSADSPKHRKRKGRMSDAEMITILILFHSNTFRNFKHFYLFYVCRGLKKSFPIYFLIHALLSVCLVLQYPYCYFSNWD